MGCSSAHLHPMGAFEPTGACLSYLASGSPALVGNLWDVTDKDIDRFTASLVGHLTKRPGASLLEALAASRVVCKLRNLTGSAPVCYGIPVSTES